MWFWQARNHAAPRIDNNSRPAGSRRVRLQFLRIVQSTFRCVTLSRIKIVDPAGKVEMSVHTREPRPGKRKIGIENAPPARKNGRLSLKKSALSKRMNSCVLQKPGRADRHCKLPDCLLVWLLTPGARGRLAFLQRLRDSFSDLCLHAKGVSELSIIGLGPEMGIGLRVYQLNVYPHLIGRLLNAAFKDVCYAKLLCDLTRFLGLLDNVAWKNGK